MITYAYWALVFGVVIGAVLLIGVKMDNVKAALISAVVLLLVGWAAYYFHFQQVFVKRYGGVMSLSVPGFRGL